MEFILLTLLLIPLSHSFPGNDNFQFDPKIKNSATVWQPNVKESPNSDSRVSSSDVILYLRTQKNRENAVKLTVEDASKLAQIDFYDPNRPNFFLIHGWADNYSGDVNSLVGNALLDTEDINVFVVDWSSVSYKLYPAARYSVPGVSNYLAVFIGDLLDQFGLSPSSVKIVGHSLGAHIAGIAGADLFRKRGTLVDYVVGLDPALPLFFYEAKDDRLDEGDAQHVQVIHTAMGLVSFVKPLGHVDLYPNGGKKQPGCKLLEDLGGKCSHMRSIKLFSESITNPAGFLATLCNNWDKFENGECDGNPTTTLGGFKLDKTARGVYYIKTNSKSPFALN